MAFDLSFRQVQAGFFEPEKILDRIKRGEARAQSQFGAFVRRRMKSSIRYRDQVAAIGAPPSAHRSKSFTREKKNKKTGAATRQSQSPLRELIYFARDPDRDSVVIGPVAFGRRVAHTIEAGGTGTVRDPRTGLPHPASFAPHPFAEPAGRAEAQNLRTLLRGMAK